MNQGGRILFLLCAAGAVAACDDPGDESDCPVGSYLAADGACTTDCVAGENECSDGLTCGSDGRCAEVNDDADCPDATVALTPQTPTVVLLIDQSGSMTADFGDGLTRYEAVEEALVNPTTGVVTTLGDRVSFGASLYMSQGGSAGGQCPIITDVAPGDDRVAQISQLFDDNIPTADTPTAEALADTAMNFASVSGPRIMVLATDGDPDTCADPDSNGQDESKALSEQAVIDAFDAEISTFILSVGTQVTESHLQRMANAGQGLDVDSGDAQFYVANDPTELNASFDEIIRGVRSCEIDLDQAVDPAEVDRGTVILNGEEIDHGIDWELKDERTIELLDAACDQLLNTDEVELSATFPCGIVVL